MNKYSYNKNFFEEKGNDYYYFLGIALSDGCIVERGNNHSYTWTSSDVEWIENICNHLQASISYTDGKPANRKDYATLRIHDNDICDILIADGCVPRKTSIVQMPYIPDNCFHAFLRGVIDGDGNVRFRKRSIKGKGGMAASSYIVSASNKFVQQLQTTIKRIFDIDTTIISIQPKPNMGFSGNNPLPLYRLLCDGYKASLLFKHIVGACDFALSRKTILMVEAITYYNEKYIKPKSHNFDVQDTRNIRTMYYKNGISYKDISEQYDCSISSIHRIVTGIGKYGSW